jgi:hypothetical protein
MYAANIILNDFGTHTSILRSKIAYSAGQASIVAYFILLIPYLILSIQKWILEADEHRPATCSP